MIEGESRQQADPCTTWCVSMNLWIVIILIISGLSLVKCTCVYKCIHVACVYKCIHVA